MLNVVPMSLGPLQTNCYILYNNNRKAVVIDPGADAEAIIKKISELDLYVECVILTHGHFDHIGAVDVICDKYGCYVIINKADSVFLTNSKYNLSDRFYTDGIIVNTNDIRCVDECSKKIIGFDFDFISTPGHSPGSMCIAVENYLFTGDTLFYLSIGNEFKPFGDMALEINSIKQKIVTLDKDYVCFPGHGESTSLFFEAQNNPYLR